jgi:hypothetical protein
MWKSVLGFICRAQLPMPCVKPYVERTTSKPLSLFGSLALVRRSDEQNADSTFGISIKGFSERGIKFQLPQDKSQSSPGNSKSVWYGPLYCKSSLGELDHPTLRVGGDQFSQ